MCLNVRSRRNRRRVLQRFFHIIKELSHEALVRFCNIDYDREMAIIAEVREGEKRDIELQSNYLCQRVSTSTLFFAHEFDFPHEVRPGDDAHHLSLIHNNQATYVFDGH